MKNLNASLTKAQLTREEMRTIVGGRIAEVDGLACKSCRINSDCASGACIKYSQTGCEQLQCGCGKFC